MEFHELAASIWLDSLGLSPELRHDLERLLRFRDAMPEHLARHGSVAVFPLVTTAAFVMGDVRDLVVAAIEQIGDSAAPTLVTTLEQPLFETYWATWRKAGLASPGAVSEAMQCSRYVYARALEGLDKIVQQQHEVRPWMPAAQMLAFRYRESPQSGSNGFYGPAVWVANDVRYRLSSASGVFVGMAYDAPAPPGLDANATGWGRSVAQRQLHEQNESMRVAEEARQADIAGAFFAGTYAGKHVGSGCLLPALVLIATVVGAVLWGPS